MIRRMILTLCVAALAACSTMTTTEPPASAPTPAVTVATAVAGKVQLEGKRGLIFASNAYQAAGAIVVPLIRADKLTSPQVDRVEALNRTAVALLAGTDKALSLADRAAGVFKVADELYRLAGR